MRSRPSSLIAFRFNAHPPKHSIRRHRIDNIDDIISQSPFIAVASPYTPTLSITTILRNASRRLLACHSPSTILVALSTLPTVQIFTIKPFLVVIVPPTEAMSNIDPCSLPLGYTIVPLRGYNVASKASRHNLKPRTILQVEQ